MRKNQILAILITLSIIAVVVGLVWATIFFGILKWILIGVLGPLAAAMIFMPIWDGITRWLDTKDMTNK